ncbi:MAG: FliA/WhiG family RNA polymerase sigma factor [Phycisphaerae bacterium]|nr:FliA/WhiG family RNA polymerase sigma factor [Phycisphaerae bacterium]
MPQPEYSAGLAPATEQTPECPDGFSETGSGASVSDVVSVAAEEFAAGCADDGGNGHLRPAALRAYGRQVRQVRQDDLIVQYLPLVHKIVHQIASYLSRSASGPLNREDLVSAGTIGLVKAARDFDPAQQAEFKTYAYIRVRGAIIDELRGWSFAPPQLKRQFDQAQEIVRQTAEHTGRTPSDEELAAQLDMPVAKMYRMFENARARNFLSIHALSDEAPSLADALTASGEPRPEEGLDRRELLQQLTRAIADLPKRQRQIIILYYGKELTMKQIAEVLHVTESRISQLHAAAVFRLSAKLKTFSDSEA